MNTIKCKNCNHEISSYEVIGNWIKCPLCGSINLVDYSTAGSSSSSDVIDSAGKSQKDANKVTSDELCEYYFPVLSTFTEFETQCFDRIMQVVPVDFTKLMTLEKREIYLPFVSNIGGEDDSTYQLQYVGKEEINFPFMNEKLKNGFPNNHFQFGLEKRIKDCSKLKNKVEIDLEVIEALRRSKENITDEVHYYPCYYMCCQYKSVKYNFFAFGNSYDISYDVLPVEPRLKDSIPCYFKDSLGYKIASVITFVMIAVALIIGLYCYGDGINTFMNRHWLALISVDWLQNSNPLVILGIGMLAAIPLIIVLLFTSLFSKMLRFIVNTIIFTLIGIVVIVNILVYSVFVLPVIFLINRMRQKRYYSIVYPIQLRKQYNIKMRYGIELEKLYIDTSRVPTPFDFSELGFKWFRR